MNIHKHSDYLQAYHALVNELERPDFDSDTVTELLQDLGAALCMEQDEGDEVFEQPYPGLLDYLHLSALVADRYEDLSLSQRVNAHESLLEMLDLMDAAEDAE